MHQRFLNARMGLTILAMAGAMWAIVPPLPLLASGPAAGNLHETQACLDCHDDQASGLKNGPHAVGLATGGTHIDCTDCHTGAAAHWQDDPEANPMSNPARQNVSEVSAVCLRCHSETHPVDQGTISPHFTAGVTCLNCHQLHGNSREHFLKDSQPELCFSCHKATRGDFARPYRHPAGEGEFLQCSSCHLEADESIATAARQGTNAICLTCHAEFQGPFPYEHQATVDYGTDEGGCISCHEPHGSYVPQLLKQPYEAPNYQTCTQCHSVPLHNNNINHGTEWAGVSCSECHVDIHGSYTNKNFLSTALEAQGCFAAGCHSR